MSSIRSLRSYSVSRAMESISPKVFSSLDKRSLIFFILFVEVVVPVVEVVVAVVEIAVPIVEAAVAVPTCFSRLHHRRLSSYSNKRRRPKAG